MFCITSCLYDSLYRPGCVSQANMIIRALRYDPFLGLALCQSDYKGSVCIMRFYDSRLQTRKLGFVRLGSDKK